VKKTLLIFFLTFPLISECSQNKQCSPKVTSLSHLHSIYGVKSSVVSALQDKKFDNNNEIHVGFLNAAMQEAEKDNDRDTLTTITTLCQQSGYEIKSIENK
jgi:hypothetical protein